MLKPEIMRNLISIFIIVIISAFIISCSKDKCQTCTKTIGGVAGNYTDEVKEVCNNSEAQKLEESSASTTVWKCE